MVATNIRKPKYGYIGTMTTAQRNALPVEYLRAGNWIYNTTTAQAERYNGAAWGAFP